MQKLFAIDAYDSEGNVVYKKEDNSLMTVRVFCEQQMYNKLNSGEWNTIVINRLDGLDNSGHLVIDDPSSMTEKQSRKGK